MNHNNIAIYQCIMSRIPKSEAINLFKNSDLNEKIIIKYIIYIYIRKKISKCISDELKISSDESDENIFNI